MAPKKMDAEEKETKDGNFESYCRIYGVSHTAIRRAAIGRTWAEVL